MHNDRKQSTNPHTAMMIVMAVVAILLLVSGADAFLLVPLLACAVMMGGSGHGHGSHGNDTRAAAAPYGRWIYASTALALVGAIGLSGSLGAAPFVTVAGAALVGLGIVGAVVGAVGIFVAERPSTGGRRSARSGQ